MSQFNNKRNAGSQYNNGFVAKPTDSMYPKLSIEFLDLKTALIQKKEKLSIFKTLSFVLGLTWREIRQLGKDGIGFETFSFNH